MLTRGVRGPQREDPEKHWTPVRESRRPYECSFCGLPIPVAKIGTRTGDRGTKHYWNRLTNERECTACRDEATRAELARSA